MMASVSSIIFLSTSFTRANFLVCPEGWKLCSDCHFKPFDVASFKNLLTICLNLAKSRNDGNFTIFSLCFVIYYIIFLIFLCCSCFFCDLMILFIFCVYSFYLFVYFCPIL